MATGCLTDEQLDLLASEQLTGAAAEALHHHIAVCGDCGGRLQRCRANLALAAELRAVIASTPNDWPAASPSLAATRRLERLFEPPAELETAVAARPGPIAGHEVRQEGLLRGGPSDTPHGSRLPVFVLALRQRWWSVAAAAFALAMTGLVVLLSVLYHRSKVDRKLAVEARNAESARAEDLRRLLYASSLARAARAGRDRDYPHMRRLLAECPDELRGWEWEWLWAQTDVSSMTLSAHGSKVTAVRFSPDGGRLLTQAADRLRVWDVAWGREVLATAASTGAGTSATWGPDGRVIAAAVDGRNGAASSDTDGPVRILRADSGDLVRALGSPEYGILNLAFDPSGRLLAGAGTDGVIRVWDWSIGHPILATPAHAGPVDVVAFSPDGQRLVSAGADGLVKTWDAITGRLIRDMRGHESRVLGAEFSPDGRLIASAGGDHSVRLWDADSGDPVAVLRGHGGRVTSVAFSPDGRMVASASEDRTVRLWDVDGRRERTILGGHDGEVLSVAFSPDGRQLASCGTDSLVKLWMIDDLNADREVVAHRGAVCGLWIDAESRVLSAAEDGSLARWTIRADGRLDRQPADPPPVGAGATVLCTDGHRLAVARGDRTIAVSDIDGPAPAAVRTAQAHSLVRALAFAPDRLRLFIGCETPALGTPEAAQTLGVWEVDSGRSVSWIGESASSITALAISPNGEWLAGGGGDAAVRLWNARTGDCVRSMRGHEMAVTALAFSPDGRLLVSAGRDAKLIVWDAASGAAVRELKGNTAEVRCVVFTPDGRRIVSGGADRTIRFWDTATGQALLDVPTPNYRPTSLAFTADGRRLIHGGTDGGLRVWRTRSESPAGDLRLE